MDYIAHCGGINSVGHSCVRVGSSSDLTAGMVNADTNGYLNVPTTEKVKARLKEAFQLCILYIPLLLVIVPRYPMGPSICEAFP